MLKRVMAIVLIPVIAALAVSQCVHIHNDGLQFINGLFLAANVFCLADLVRFLARGRPWTVAGQLQ